MMVLISLSQIVRTSPSWSRMWFFLLLWLVVIVLDVDNVSCSSDLFSGFYLTAENLGQERLWTRSVSSSTLQQLQSLGRRRRRNQLQAKCRWVRLPGQRVSCQVRNSQAPDVSTALALAGDSGGSDHQCQPPAGGLWQRQDREKWQFLSLCESLGHRRVFLGLKCSQRHLSVIISISSYSCAVLYVKSSFSLARVNSSGSTSVPQGNWLLLILKHVSNRTFWTESRVTVIDWRNILQLLLGLRACATPNMPLGNASLTRAEGVLHPLQSGANSDIETARNCWACQKDFSLTRHFKFFYEKTKTRGTLVEFSVWDFFLSVSLINFVLSNYSIIKWAEMLRRNRLSIINCQGSYVWEMNMSWDRQL